MAKPPIALLIDAENLPPGLMPSILEHAEEFGDPAVRCVFGDFSANRMPAWITMAKRFAMEIVFQGNGGKGKNSTDIAVTIRAMDLLSESFVEGICLVSSDRDFIPLAIRLRRSGLKVFGIGEAKADIALRAACTDYRILEKPAHAKAAKQAVRPSEAVVMGPAFSKSDEERLRKIISGAFSTNDPSVGLPQLCKEIRARDPELADRFCRKGKFLNNLRACRSIQLVGEGSSTRSS